MTTTTVDVGAIVSVRNEATGAARTLTIVRSEPSLDKGEISAASLVARALLGHATGDTVTVAATRPTRYTITDVVPAPEPEKPVAQALPSTEIVEFVRGEDDDYEAWVRRHPTGYVARKADRAADGYVLHLAECGHLNLDGAKFTLRTANPRRCCSSRHTLEDWCREQTGYPPRRCGSCFG